MKHFVCVLSFSVSSIFLFPVPAGNSGPPKIVKILAKGNLVQGSIASPLDKVTLKTLTSDIQKIKSKKYSIEKN